MNYYCIASDFKANVIEEYARLNRSDSGSRIWETYGQITVGNEVEAGRDCRDIPQVDLYELRQYIAFSQSRGIGFHYVLNSPCMGNREFTPDGVRQLREHLKRLYEAGVRSLTVALPSVMDIVRSTGLDFHIKVSIIAQINTPNKAVQYRAMGADRIVLDEAVVRRFDLIRSIAAAFGPRVEVIANSLCHKDCIYRAYHYNQTGHDSLERPDGSIRSYYNHKCMLRRAQGAEEWLKLCWIRPEDIPWYNQAGIHYFKLQGRHTVAKGDPVRAAECYFSQRYDGNLIDLLELFGCPYELKPSLDNRSLDGFLKPFVDRPDFCASDCARCGYCASVAKRCMPTPETGRLMAMSKEFYTEFDPYAALLRQCQEEDDR